MVSLHLMIVSKWVLLEFEKICKKGNNVSCPLFLSAWLLETISISGLLQWTKLSQHKLQQIPWQFTFLRVFTHCWLRAKWAKLWHYSICKNLNYLISGKFLESPLKNGSLQLEIEFDNILPVEVVLIGILMLLFAVRWRHQSEKSESAIYVISVALKWNVFV